MSVIKTKFTVLFREPFWVGIFERETDGRYEAAQVVFGAEPTDNEVYELLLERWKTLKFSPAVKQEIPEEKKINPKRARRIVSKQMNEGFVGTKAQQALKLLQEQNKTERAELSREQKLLIKERKFELKQEKRKEKHKGH